MNMKAKAIFLAAALTFAPQVHAQTYPTKPIRVIVPVSPGALTDIVARRIGAAAAQIMGQQWVLENRPGANFIIPAEACRRANPDGYTFCVLTTSALTFNPHLIDNLPYNPATDLKAVINLGMFVGGLVASPKLDVKTIDDLKKAMLAKPDGFNFGTYGPSTSPNFFRLFLQERLGVKASEIPYKGASELVSSLVSGELQLTYTALGNWADNPGDAKGRILVQDGARRSARLPNVPTVGEAGLGEFPIKTWIGLFAPGGVPDAIIDQVNRQVGEAINKAEVRDFLIGQIIEPSVTTAKEFSDFVAKERDETGKLFQKYNIPKIK
jgi:tripartite-type tricarboxylate transporter receptor subunit TctC